MQDKKIVLIFGAANGLGRNIALELANSDNHLIIVDKDLKKLESLDDQIGEKGGSSTIVHLDLIDFPKIFELASVIYQKFAKVDLLISCAAMLGEIAPLDHFDTKIWGKVIDTNLNANAHIIKAFTPILKLSSAPEVIFTTCSASEEARAYWGAYSVSKVALKNLIQIYAAENQTSNLKIAMFDPGVMDTKIRYQAMPNEDKTKITSAENVAEFFVQKLTKDSFRHGDILEYE